MENNNPRLIVTLEAADVTVQSSAVRWEFERLPCSAVPSCMLRIIRASGLHHLLIQDGPSAFCCGLPFLLFHFFFRITRS